MLTTIYLILSICTGPNSCEYGIVDTFQGQPKDAVMDCMTEKESYPQKLQTGCYIKQGEDKETEYYESVDDSSDEFLEIYK